MSENSKPRKRKPNPITRQYGRIYSPLVTGQQQLPQGQQALPQVPQQLPQGQQALPQVPQQLPQGQQALPQVPQQLPQGQQALPQVPQQLPQGQQQSNNARPNQQDTSRRPRMVRFLFDQTEIVPGNRSEYLRRMERATSQFDQSQTKENPSRGL